MRDEPPDNIVPIKPKRAPTKGTRIGNGSGSGQWGGPAKGAGMDASALIPGAHTKPNMERRSARMADAAEQLKDHLMTLAFSAERESDQIAATFKMITILEGMPVARVVTATTADLQRMSDDDLKRELARLNGA